MKPVVFAEARFPAAETQPEILDVGFGTSEAGRGDLADVGIEIGSQQKREYHVDMSWTL